MPQTGTKNAADLRHGREEGLCAATGLPPLPPAHPNNMAGLNRPGHVTNMLTIYFVTWNSPMFTPHSPAWTTGTGLPSRLGTQSGSSMKVWE